MEFQEELVNRAISQTNYTEKPEDARAPIKALGESFNSLMSARATRDIQAQPVDISGTEDLTFDRINIDKHFSEKGYSQSIIQQLRTEPLRDWEEATRRAKRLNRIEENHKIIAENYSTSQTLALGLPMALVDWDLVIGGGIYKGIQATAKAAGVSSKLGKIATTGLAVGTYAVADNMVYETLTTKYEEGTNAKAFLFGAMLGSGGQLLVKGLEKNAEKVATSVVREQNLTDAVAVKQEELDKVNSLIEQVTMLQKDESALQKELEKSQVKDRSLLKFDLKERKQKLLEDRDIAKSKLDEASANLRSLLDTKKSKISAIKKAERLAAKYPKAQEVITAYKEKSRDLTFAAAPIKTSITKMEKKLGTIARSRTAENNAKRVELRANIKLAKNKLERIQAKQGKLETAYNTAKDTEAAYLASKNSKEIEVLTKEIERLNLAQEKREASVTNAKLQRKKASDAYNKAKTFVPKESEGVVRWETQSLQQKLASYGADLSPEGLRKLVEAKGLAEGDLLRVANEDLGLKAFKEAKANVEKSLEKLTKELNEFDKVRDFRDSPHFKKIPKWAKKLVISPIERLLTSENETVRGIAEYLHSGTMYHGVIRKYNAWNLRTFYDGKVQRLNAALIYNHKQARADGYTGSVKDFEQEVGKEMHRVNGNIQQDIWMGMPATATDAEREVLAAAKSKSVQRKYTTSNEWIRKSVDNYLDYYEEMWSIGNKLQGSAFIKSLPKGYTNRVGDRQKIEAMGADSAIELLVEAQLKHARATHNPIDETAFRGKATSFVTSTLNGEEVRRQITEPFDRKATSPSPLKQRTMMVFDSDIAQVLSDEATHSANIYGFKTHGRLAILETLGIESLGDFEKMLENAGANSKEIDDLRVVLQTVLGTRELSRNPYDPFTRAIKGVSSISSVLHTMAFAIPSMTELASPMKEFGFKRTMSELGGSVGEVADIYRFGTPSEKNTISMLSSYGDAHFMTKANRYGEENTLDSVGLQHKLDDLVRKESVYGGLLPVTDALRLLTTTLSVDFLAKMSVKQNLTKEDIMRLGDMGFTQKELGNIRKKLDVQPDGTIGNTDRTTWGKLDMDITLGVQTMVERTILNPNGATLPKFMTNMNEGQFIPRVMLKFMRFPIEAHERLLLRGFQYGDANQAVALTVNIGMWGLILSAKDALREEEKKQYTGDEGEFNLMRDAFLYNSFTSSPVLFSDLAFGLVTGENFTNDYDFSYGGSPMSDFARIQRGDLTVSAPFYNVKVGEAAGEIWNNLAILDETTGD
jgi:hypothetical protein